MKAHDFEVTIHRRGLTVSPAVLESIEEMGRRMEDPQDLDDALLVVFTDEVHDEMMRRWNELCQRLIGVICQPYRLEC
ncbi:MAG TPA: hypothetical protein PLU30_24550 [Verrucomicrobiae bacterium]|nr:hypothetical protein [Verrucomicrobiae bacterium]